MIVTLDFIPSTEREWFSSASENREVYITGWGRLQETCYTGEPLADAICTSTSNKDVRKLLTDLNGEFAVIIHSGDEIHIAADKIRSIPLFYKIDQNNLVVSDNIRNISSDTSISEDALIEYATSGLVTREKTIFAEISATQAGEVVVFTDDTKVQRDDYYEYKCRYDSTDPIEQLCDEFNEILLEVFERVTSELDGRQVVIPLSGGLDSRLVASMFRRCGYENVLCFSYGLPDNDESEKSQEIAASLSYDWEFIEYSSEMWKRLLNSERMREYWDFSANGVSLPHINDWPAVKRLQENCVIDQDAIFVPGHTGDFLSGSHLKYLYDPRYYSDPNDFDGALVTKHYSMWEDLHSDNNLNIIQKEIDRFKQQFEGDNIPSMYEYWEWRERQSKYILNSLRVYEYFGYDWRVPLWEDAIKEFWKKIPKEQKINKYLYKTYLTTYDPTDVYDTVTPKKWDREKIQRQHNKRVKTKIRSIIEKTPLEVLLRYRKHFNDYRTHPLGIGQAYGLGYIFANPWKRHHEALVLRDVLKETYGIKLSTIGSSKESSRCISK